MFGSTEHLNLFLELLERILAVIVSLFTLFDKLREKKERNRDKEKPTKT